MSATPGTAVTGSGVTTISATPAFFSVELGELGLETLFNWCLTCLVSMLDATLLFASCNLVRESATERAILFSSIDQFCLLDTYVNGCSQSELPVR